MSKRIHVQEIGKPEDKLIFIEFGSPSHDLIIDAVLKQFQSKGFDVIWGVNS